MIALRTLWTTLKQGVSDFFTDDAMTLGAALAFYTALSLAPLLVILLTVASLIGDPAQEQLIGQIQSVVGPQAGEGIRMIIENGEKTPKLGTIAGIVGLVVLLFSASGVFAQLQASLNRIWDVRAKPSQGIWGYMRKRLLSLGMVLAFGFILLVSLGISAALGLIFPNTGIIWQAVTFLVSLAVFTALFATMFRYLPDVQIQWRDVLFGALLTAILFALGKFLIALYLARSSVASAYGAAGSFLILLLWVYYASLIVFLGAELTQAYARERGSPIVPDRYAEWEPDAEEARRERGERGEGGKGQDGQERKEEERRRRAG